MTEQAHTEQAGLVLQAGSDLDAHEALRETDLPGCHHLHLLQMATEKLAKAISLNSSPTGFGRTHVAFSKVTGALRVHSPLAGRLGWSVAKYQHFRERAHRLMRAIEELHPQVPTDGVPDGPNVEYPWERPDGSWMAPASFRFPAEDWLRSADGIALLKLVRVVANDFNRLFG